MLKAAISSASGLIIILIFFSTCREKEYFTQRNLDFNQNWRFVEDSIQGAQNADFDDRHWRLLDLPHDWSVEDFKIQDEHFSFYQGRALIIVRSTGAKGLIRVSLNAGDLKSRVLNIRATNK